MAAPTHTHTRVWVGVWLRIGELDVEGLLVVIGGLGVEGFVSGDWGVRCGGVC